jgi:hypothetical protein
MNKPFVSPDDTQVFEKVPTRKHFRAGTKKEQGN